MHLILFMSYYFADDESSELSSEEKLLNDVFVKDSIPPWLAGSGYVGLAAISTATVPMMFPQLKWYLVLFAYVVAPLLAFCNSYGTGLTDWNLASTYGKIGLFIFASWVGRHGGVIAGLAACGVMMSIVSTAGDLMHDFKTGYLTLSSPRSMFVSQLIGTALGCVIAPSPFGFTGWHSILAILMACSKLHTLSSSVRWQFWESKDSRPSHNTA